MRITELMDKDLIIAELYSNETFVARATNDTLVCCWDTTDPNIIYVDKKVRILKKTRKI